MQPEQVVLFTRSDTPITVDWLRLVTPAGTKVREIPLPGFMLNDSDEKSSISVRVCDGERRKIALDWIGRLRWRRPPHNVRAELDSRPIAVEMHIMRDERGHGIRHPIALAIVKALDAIAEHDDTLYDDDMIPLSGASRGIRKSGPPPYDPNGPIDYKAFECIHEQFYTGTIKVAWLLGDASAVIECNVEPIPLALRTALERAASLPLSTRDELGRLVREYARTVLPHVPTDIWPLLSEPCISIPAKPKRTAYFDVAFECEWDPEHGIQVRFDEHGRPLRVDMQ